ncbi:MAG: riboflavin biosynthesis protein RibF [Rhizobiales bacterium PAR1]|nr:MAG: riboflavin biosynthesis protein RibF [Rhizobiales bacterium PAR1]
MNEYSADEFRIWRPAGALNEGYPSKQKAVFRVVAIGNFDGAHRGHAAVAAEVRALAAVAGAGRVPECLALTFDPHPRMFFQPDKPHFRLLASDRRFLGLKRIGFDGAVVLPFNAELAAMSPEAFIREILLERLGADGVVVGEDFHFGKARAGTPAFLAAEGARIGLAVRFVSPFRDENGTVISSSAIRKALAAGDIPAANAMLGYTYAVHGPVIHGEKRGRDLGFPTANMRLDPAFGLAHGIYAVKATVDGQHIKGVANFGRRPHFDNGAPLLETYLFDFSGNLYGKDIEIAFVAYLRAEAKFESLDALISQMNADCLEARRLLA